MQVWLQKVVPLPPAPWAMLSEICSSSCLSASSFLFAYTENSSMWSVSVHAVYINLFLTLFSCCLESCSFGYLWSCIITVNIPTETKKEGFGATAAVLLWPFSLHRSALLHLRPKATLCTLPTHSHHKTGFTRPVGSKLNQKPAQGQWC